MEYITAQDMWVLSLGSGAIEENPWWVSIEFVKGDWRTPGIAILEVWDPEGEEGEDTVKFEVTAAAIRKAHKVACEKYVDLCTGTPISEIGDDWDSCVADLILQIIAFGEEVYC